MLWALILATALGIVSFFFPSAEGSDNYELATQLRGHVMELSFNPANTRQEYHLVYTQIVLKNESGIINASLVRSHSELCRVRTVGREIYMPRHSPQFRFIYTPCIGI